MENKLSDRMKTYENVNRNYLMKRTPVIIRLDGVAFHTFTNGLEKPFDKILMETMIETSQYLCENIQNCKLAYTQSDEISLLLVDYTSFTTDQWYKGNIQKMASVAASMCTLAFNKFFRTNCKRMMLEMMECDDDNEFITRYEKYKSKIDTAIFDARLFNLSKEEVNNYFLWRQQDASRNSIQALGQAHFSHKQLHCKSYAGIQDMLFNEKQIDWNNIETSKKRGTCIKRELDIKTGYNKWVIDREIPIFSHEPEYINKLVGVGE